MPNIGLPPLPYISIETTVYDMSPIRHLPVIFVNGVPGAGNETVAQTISNFTGYAMIKPDELILQEVVKDTTKSRLLADSVLAQEEFSEQVTVDLIKESMLMNQDAKGFILVGFPKNSKMSNMFNQQVKWPEKVVALEVDEELEVSRLQSGLSELGRPESEINGARQAVKDVAYKFKKVHKRFGARVVTLDISKNPNALASTLKEILSDTIELNKKSDTPEPPTAASAPALIIPNNSSVAACPLAAASSMPTSLITPADEPRVGDVLEVVMKEEEM